MELAVLWEQIQQSSIDLLVQLVICNTIDELSEFDLIQMSQIFSLLVVVLQQSQQDILVVSCSLFDQDLCQFREPGLPPLEPHFARHFYLNDQALDHFFNVILSGSNLPIVDVEESN